MTSQSNDELRPFDYEIIAVEDPDQFIDLLNMSSYTAGNVGGKIPVDRHRIIFEKWLEARDQRIKDTVDGSKIKGIVCMEEDEYAECM